MSGQFLVASRSLRAPPFSGTLILLVAHGDGGAMGLIVNRPLGVTPVSKLLSAFGIRTRNRSALSVYLGGPVDLSRGFVLHSEDYSGLSTRRIHGDIAMSTGLDVLNAIAEDRGPKRLLVLMGYAGWGAGQLEQEIARGDWMLAPADPDLVFSGHPETAWERAMQRAGFPL